MSSYAFRQEFMASFEARGSEVFKEDWIKFSEEKPENYDCYVAVDVSGFQDLVKKKTKIHVWIILQYVLFLLMRMVGT